MSHLRTTAALHTTAAPSRLRTAAAAALLTLAASFVGVFATAGPASAHVTVNPREAAQGGYARVAFRVPTESDTANTTKVEVFLPEDTPIASVSTMPVAGWTVQVERKAPAKPVEAHGTQITEVVSKITWTATGDAAVKPGQFQEFPVSLGPLPEVERLVFKALQTYSDNNVVRWIEEPTEGEEPERPAPVLELEPAEDDDVPAGAQAGGESSAADDDEDSESGAALGLAIAGLVAGLAGAALGGLALARSRRRPDAPTSA